MPLLTFDIFCRVIDNFGDIGVCWRLAMQLGHHAQVGAVRLWVDDLDSFRRIEPRVEPALPGQDIDNVHIVYWTDNSPPLVPAQVVIEAFACNPPCAFIKVMATHDSLWINLEYLSAEDWIASCHGLPSLQPGGQQKYFFFPGFTSTTGGLLREPELIAERDDFLRNPQLRLDFLQSLGLASQPMQALQAGARLVSLFCYPDAPVTGLIHALRKSTRPSVLLVPQGVCPDLHESTHSDLHICRIPFTTQAGYDRLLWSADLNFVRGEDSLVRALWAGKPLVWNIYPQDDKAHLDKLNAWLQRAGLGKPIAGLMQAWNDHDAQGVAMGLDAVLDSQQWVNWQKVSLDFHRCLASMPDLASTLISFCTNHRRTG